MWHTYIESYIHRNLLEPIKIPKVGVVHVLADYFLAKRCKKIMSFGSSEKLTWSQHQGHLVWIFLQFVQRNVFFLAKAFAVAMLVELQLKQCFTFVLPPGSNLAIFVALDHLKDFGWQKMPPFKSTHVSLVFVEFLPIVQSPENEATRWWRFCSESCYDQSLPQQRALLDIQSCGIRTGKSIASHVHRGLPPFGIARHELPEWSTWEADDAQQKVRCKEFWKGQSGRTICTAWFSNFCVVLDREVQSCLLL